jgi:cold shock CspA family protein
VNQSRGKLTTWKSERGFGFIRPDGGGKDVFVHIRDFGNISRDPKVGDSIRFSPMKDASGKLRAADVNIEGVTRTPSTTPKQNKINRGKKSSSTIGWVFGTLLFAGFIIFENAWDSMNEPTPSNTLPVPKALSAKGKQFRCAGKHYCSQMRSCDEARFYLQSCPDPKMDGDGDGIPCEKQWC